MDEEEPKKSDEAPKGADKQPVADPSEPDAGPATTEPKPDSDKQPVVPPKAPTTSGQDITNIRASVLRDPLDGGIARAMREFNMSERMGRDLDLIRSPLNDLISGRNQLHGVARAVAEAQKAMEAAGGFSALHDRMTRASAGLDALGGLENVMRQQREMERTISGLGGIDAVFGGHSAMRDAVTALGGIESIMKRHDEMNLLASGSLAAASYATGTSFAASQAIERAMRDIAGVSSFTGLLGNGGLNRTQLDALVSGTQAWRAGSGSLSLVATLRTQLPDLVPERRRATAADFASAGLSRFGERFVRDSARLARLQDEMLGLRRPWVDVGNPGQSVSAYVDARALATIVENGPPESRAVATAVREELGDYRETDPVPEVVAADPVLRSAFRLEVGYNADLSSLPPAIIATVFGGLGGALPRRIEADPDALESAVHQRARRLELKLRRFIEKKMIAARGRSWSKQRVPGKTVTGWRARRQTDIDNGRTPSRLFDYAGFEDYRAIIEQKDNWAEVFEPIFKVKTSILETLRRLSMIRNPDAHYRIVTIEDFLDLHTEGRRLDAWMDAAS
ncbi:hypothetical protein NKI04_21620 [Mesorhizobium sp. M0814]|uniref:hypothetical protein n=1 Tax=Mesorhizobium sp. M0814 TaxID=2957004 RepID=UPI00333A05CB